MSLNPKSFGVFQPLKCSLMRPASNHKIPGEKKGSGREPFLARKRPDDSRRSVLQGCSLKVSFKIFIQRCQAFSGSDPQYAAQTQPGVWSGFVRFLLQPCHSKSRGSLCVTWMHPNQNAISRYLRYGRMLQANSFDHVSRAVWANYPLSLSFVIITLRVLFKTCYPF